MLLYIIVKNNAPNANIFNTCVFYIRKRATWEFKALQNGFGLFHLHCGRLKEQAVQLGTWSAAVLDSPHPSR